MANLKVSLLADWATDFNEPCSCGRGTISIYVCSNQDCPNKDQKLFCTECIIQDFKHHHKRVPIKEELETRIKEWQGLTEEAKKIKNIIDVHYSKHKALV